MSVPIYQVDAFTDRLFTGNPAAVCLLAGPRDKTWMQNLAAEMNLSETAYVVPRADGFDLRWFTPAVEVDLCGHATLASAHVLWETGQVPPDLEANFHTASGLLTARRDGEWIELDFPAFPPQQCAVPPLLLEGLGVKPVWVGRSGDKFLVELENEQAVRAVAPNFGRLRDLEASSRASSGRPSASTRIPSRARRTATPAPTGRIAWERASSWRTRSRAARAWSGSACRATGRCSAARR
jgi:predicted PhzF superfamily epimerase YddE/YHI9